MAKFLPGRFAIVVGFDGVRNVKAQVAELYPEGLPRDAQQPGRLVLIPAGELEHTRQQQPIELGMRLCVEVFGIGNEPLIDEGFQREIIAGRRRDRWGLRTAR